MTRTLKSLRTHRIIGLAAALALGFGATMALADDSSTTSTTPPSGGNQVLSGPTTMGSETGPKSFAGEHRGGGPAEIIHKLMDGLGLTDAQREQIKTLLETFRTNRQAWEKTNGPQVKTLRDQIQAIRQAGGDKTQAKALETQLHTLTETAPKPKELFAQIRAVLTTSQQTTFDQHLQQLMEERKENRSEMKGNGGPTTQPGNSNSATPAGSGGSQLNL